MAEQETGNRDFSSQRKETRRTILKALEEKNNVLQEWSWPQALSRGGQYQQPREARTNLTVKADRMGMSAAELGHQQNTETWRT